ncbi:gliding motility-associated ABC transporter substrate-binding protein GldG [Sediminicola luteus]|uniref:Gliding motility-associated ABC transporter substrate-binding protein GldG n=1 Tax=Sediminicola luteus TaxID=319238 RepID=A0A2A4G3X7_9FLAO|nr:gliding motility-associated ABC transporter substrate-binding protein GldG [Sediminicola luteus]PCE62666.1 gliding motility-associated ABC transporter substrate-binding protein GldG [Sediminicola luteus]
MTKSDLMHGVKALLALVAINILAQWVPIRFDLTEDQRYSLSESAVDAIAPFESPVIVDVLLDGNLPPEFAKLKTETALILESFAQENPNVKFDFVDPLQGAQDQNRIIGELQALGLTPTQLTTTESAKVSQEMVFPWAMVNYQDRTIKVPLLKNKLGASTEEMVNNSVQHLEYAFADAFAKASRIKKKSVAIMRGNGELPDLEMADFLTSIRDYYNIGVITLDSVANNAEKTLSELQKFDLALIAKPTEAFSDAEKLVMDQYIVNGGKTMWLLDPVVMELDSLLNNQGKNLAFPRDLNLNDFFFPYGVRLNNDLVNDMYFTQIVLASGSGNQSQYDPVPWVYHPMVFSKNSHAITNNLEALRIQFGSSIDLLDNDYTQSVLLQSSSLSKADGIPRTIDLGIIKNPPAKEQYTPGNLPMGVLIEGAFSSAYKNRVKPIELSAFKDDGPENQIIVIADGDLIRNQTRQGRPLELGYDKWTNNFYGNKEFLINCLNYMLDDSGLINIRNKQVSIPFLDREKVAQDRSYWQLLNIGVPLVLLILLALGFTWYRKRRFSA